MGPGKLLSYLPEQLKQAIKDRVYPSLLPEGDIAPEWQLQAHDRTWHRLGPYWSVMVFLPFCPQQPRVLNMLDSIQQNHEKLRAVDARVVVMMPAEEAPLTELASSRSLDYPLLTDRGASVARLYRAAIQLPLHPMIIPTAYLVNPNKKIRLANRGTPALEAIYRSIQALRETTRGGM